MFFRFRGCRYLPWCLSLSLLSFSQVLVFQSSLVLGLVYLALGLFSFDFGLAQHWTQSIWYLGYLYSWSLVFVHIGFFLLSSSNCSSSSGLGWSFHFLFSISSHRTLGGPHRIMILLILSTSCSILHFLWSWWSLLDLVPSYLLVVLIGPWSYLSFQILVSLILLQSCSPLPLL